MSDLGTANCGCGCEGRDRFGGDCGCGGCNGGCGCGNNGCGFGNNSCLWIILLLCCCGGFGNGCGCGNNGCGNDSCLWIFSAAVVVSATDAAMAVDADARQHNISCIGLKRRSHFSVSFFIYIYNADPGRSHYGRKTFKTNDTI